MTQNDVGAFQTSLLQFAGVEKTAEQATNGGARMLTETEKAWLAGVIDGEGSIFISKVMAKGRYSRRGFSYRTNLEIANSNSLFVKRVLELIGKGSASMTREKHPTWKDKWQYQGYSQVLKDILPQVLPYLIVKRKVAEKMLEYLAFVDANQIDGPQKVPDGLYKKTDALYDEIKRLNERGPNSARDNGESTPLPVMSGRRSTGNRVRNCRNLTETERAWLAAIVDGEGTIEITKRIGTKGRRGFFYIPTLQISNTNKAVLVKVWEIIGEGGVCPAKKETLHWRKKWLYHGSAGILRAILPQILPYLIIKKEHARTILEYLQYVRDNQIVGLTEIPPGYYEGIDALYLTMKKMNEKGKGAGIM